MFLWHIGSDDHDASDPMIFWAYDSLLAGLSLSESRRDSEAAATVNLRGHTVRPPGPAGFGPPAGHCDAGGPVRGFIPAAARQTQLERHGDRDRHGDSAGPPAIRVRRPPPSREPPPAGGRPDSMMAARIRAASASSNDLPVGGSLSAAAAAIRRQ